MNGRTVLVIDDDVDFADGVSEILELAGYGVEIAYSGEAGVESCSCNDFDAALIDIGLPGMNGVECLAEIKKMHPDICAFLLTGFSAAHITAQGIEAGAAEILTKPVEPENLIDRINAAFA